MEILLAECWEGSWEAVFAGVGGGREGSVTGTALWKHFPGEFFELFAKVSQAITLVLHISTWFNQSDLPKTSHSSWCPAHLFCHSSSYHNRCPGRQQSLTTEMAVGKPHEEHGNGDDFPDDTWANSREVVLTNSYQRWKHRAARGKREPVWLDGNTRAGEIDLQEDLK